MITIRGINHTYRRLAVGLRAAAPVRKIIIAVTTLCIGNTAAAARAQPFFLTSFFGQFITGQPRKRHRLAVVILCITQSGIPAVRTIFAAETRRLGQIKRAPHHNVIISALFYRPRIAVIFASAALTLGVRIRYTANRVAVPGLQLRNTHHLRIVKRTAYHLFTGTIRLRLAIPQRCTILIITCGLRG